MCNWGSTRTVRLRIQKDLSYTGEERWANKGIDSCISGIVEALQAAGLDMKGSCCGHGAADGMKTVRQQREAFLRSRGITPTAFNRSVKKMVQQDCLKAEGKQLKKSKARRATANWAAVESLMPVPGALFLRRKRARPARKCARR